ncbi:potassium channel family protein [Pseudooceanicola onchidii]|uniref:potassium channel family protein n=1 Tax=Pseudooceanicola onchidii TaxID=2562279 RepID=UPI0010AA59A2|nr:TrkA family potassium uptake protein [Pseudooceanicola onchidii]
MRHNRRNFAVIGLGNFGGTVASELVRYGKFVIGIDRDEKIVSNFAEELSQALILDSRDEQALREAGVGECDAALISMGEDLESSVLTAINLKMIGVELVWAKAVNRAHHRILSKLGVDRVFHPEEEMGRHVAQVMNNQFVRDYVSLGNGSHVFYLQAPEELDGKRLTELNLKDKHDIRCLGVMRGTEFLCDASGDCTLAPGDRLIVLGTRLNFGAFADSI